MEMEAERRGKWEITSTGGKESGNSSMEVGHFRQMWVCISKEWQPGRNIFTIIQRQGLMYMAAMRHCSRGQNNEEQNERVCRLEPDIKKFLTNMKRTVTESTEFAITRNFPA